MFAGEATNSTQFSTAHGAYNTGIRESNRILDQYNYYSKNVGKLSNLSL